MKDYVVAMISGSMALLGVLISQVTNYMLARQRATQEEGHFHRQKTKELEYRRLQNVEAIYGQAIYIVVLTGRFRTILLSKIDKDAEDSFINEFNKTFRAFIVNLDLYFPEIRLLSQKIAGKYTWLLTTKVMFGASRLDSYEEELRLGHISARWDESAAEIVAALQEIQAEMRNIIRRENLAILAPLEEGDTSGG